VLWACGRSKLALDVRECNPLGEEKEKAKKNRSVGVQRPGWSEMKNRMLSMSPAAVIAAVSNCNSVFAGSAQQRPVAVRVSILYLNLCEYDSDTGFRVCLHEDLGNA